MTEDRGGRLPTFLVIGAMRAGTTSLARQLASHPQVFLVPQKEVHFFDRRWQDGLGWYREQFSGVRGERAVGEATPSYMYLEEVPPRMAQVVPDARLIAMLRDPVDRAYSHYWHERELGHEDLGFLEAVGAEGERLRLAPTEDRGRHAYVDRGRYLAQLRRVLRSFTAEQMLVLIFEEFQRDPGATVESAYRFLDVDPRFRPERLERNWTVHAVPRSVRLQAFARRVRWRPARRAIQRLNARRRMPPPLQPEVRAQVAHLFREENAALSDWLGRPLPWSE